MRKFALTLLLVGTLFVPTLAQSGFGGRGPGLILLNKSVQEELKLSDGQKADLKKIQDAIGADAKKYWDALVKEDKAKAKEIMTKASEATAKGIAKVRDSLDGAQARRLKQIELQQEVRLTGLKVFSKEEVARALKLSDKQKESVVTTQKGLEADVKATMKDVKDRSAARQKVEALQRTALEAITRTFSDEQKTAWKELAGAPFGAPVPKDKKGVLGKERDVNVWLATNVSDSSWQTP